jgi:hypothetical protein
MHWIEYETKVWSMKYTVYSIQKEYREYRVGWLVSYRGIVGHRLMFDDFFYKSEKIKNLWPPKFYMKLILFSIIQYKTLYIIGMILERRHIVGISSINEKWLAIFIFFTSPKRNSSTTEFLEENFYMHKQNFLFWYFLDSLKKYIIKITYEMHMNMNMMKTSK